MTTRTLPASHTLRTAAAQGPTWLNWLRRAFEAIETRRYGSPYAGRYRHQPIRGTGRSRPRAVGSDAAAALKRA